MRILVTLHSLNYAEKMTPPVNKRRVTVANDVDDVGALIYRESQLRKAEAVAATSAVTIIEDQLEREHKLSVKRSHHQQ